MKKGIAFFLAAACLAAAFLAGSLFQKQKSGPEAEDVAESEPAGMLAQEELVLQDPQAIARLAASVVRLEVYDASGDKLGTGSGFAVGAPAVLVTAAHVIENMDYMLAWRDDGTSFRVEYALDADTDADVAICPLPEDAGLTPLSCAGGTPPRGEDVMVIGSQFGLTNLVSKGTVCGLWETEETDWILFSAPVSGGCSGGPLLNSAGEVIGVVTGSYEKGQNLNLAAPIERATDLAA